MAEGDLVYPWIIGNNLVIRCRYTEGYCVIPKKSAYMYDKTWLKVMKVIALVIRKMKVGNFYVLLILFSIYLTPYLCPSKISAYDT